MGEARNTSRSLHHRAAAFRAVLRANRTIFPRFSHSQDLLAFASQLMRQGKDTLDILSRGRMREIRGFAHGILHVPLKDCLHPDVPLWGNVMRGHKNTSIGIQIVALQFYEIGTTSISGSGSAPR